MANDEINILPKSERDALSGNLNLEDKNKFLVQIQSANEKENGNYGLVFNLLEDDGRPILDGKEQPRTLKTTMPAKECNFKENYIRTFLPELFEQGGKFRLEHMVGRYGYATLENREFKGNDGSMRRMLSVASLDPVPETIKKSLEAAEAAPAPAPAAPTKPVAQKPAAAPAKATPVTKPAAAKPAAPAAAKPAAAKPAAPAAKPAPAKPAAAKPAAAKPATADTPFES